VGALHGMVKPLLKYRLILNLLLQCTHFQDFPWVQVIGLKHFR